MVDPIALASFREAIALYDVTRVQQLHLRLQLHRTEKHTIACLEALDEELKKRNLPKTQDLESWRKQLLADRQK